MSLAAHTSERNTPDHWDARVDLACAFRWTVRLDMHEAVANHFSLVVDDEGPTFLINPDRRHFSLVRASDLLLLDASDPETMSRPDAPDPTAWGLHGGLHRHCPHARCVMHVHSKHATVLACLADSRLPPIDQTAAEFFNRHAVDDGYSGLALEGEGERCAALLADPKMKALVMGNHGLLVLGRTVAEAFNRMFYFERAAETYIKALWTGQELRILSDEIAERVAQQVENYPGDSGAHFFSDLKEMLDREEPDYRQ